MTNQNEKQIVYVQDGKRRTIPESQAVYMLESIAQKDMPRALTYYLNLTNDNPHAEILLKKFYDTLLQMYMFEELLEVSSARLKKIPSCFISFTSKVNALQHMFRNEEAIEILEAVVTGNPENIVSINTLGSFHKDVGNFEEAAACFDRAIKLNPSFAPAHWNRVEFSRDPEADLAALRTLIGNNQVPENQTHYLHFSAYRLSEKAGKAEDAFEHLQIANAMKRRSISYDVHLETDIDELAQSIFTKERMRELAPAQDSELRPIFIMGMPRSGTTLVEQIIASHSEVAGGDEYTAFANAILRAQLNSNIGGDLQEWLSSIGTREFHEIGLFYGENMRFVRGDKFIFTDKNQFNHRSIGLIQASVANAKIIIVERSPMDVAFGCYRQLFGSDGAKFSYQFDELAKGYASYMKLIDYWESVTSGLIRRVSYEDLVRNPESEIESIMSFCGLATEQACFDFHNTKRVVKTLSSSQVRQPMFTRGIDRWKQYEQQLQPLHRDLSRQGLI